MLTFGVEEGDVHAEGLEWVNGLPAFDELPGDPLRPCGTPGPRTAQCENALPPPRPPMRWASPLRLWSRASPPSGGGCRFEHKGSFHGAEVYDDYAHHPGELQALFDAVKSWATGGSSAPSSPTPTPGPRLSLTTSRPCCGNPISPFWLNLMPPRDRRSGGLLPGSGPGHPRELLCATLPQVTERRPVPAQPGDLILTVGRRRYLHCGRGSGRQRITARSKV